MVRNSADHGLETPAERAAAGKPEQGTIRLSAYHEGGHIIICIADNGRGLNTERIKAKAVSSGSSARRLEKMTEAQIHKFIFAPASPPPAVTSCPAAGRHGRGAHQYRPDRRHHRHQVGGRRGLQRHHQDPADAGHRLALIVEAAGDRFAIPQLSWSSWCARGQLRAPHRAHQGHRGAAAAQQAVAADAPEEAVEDRRRFVLRSGERLHRGHAGRQPDLGIW